MKQREKCLWGESQGRQEAPCQCLLHWEMGKLLLRLVAPLTLLSAQHLQKHKFKNKCLLKTMKWLHQNKTWGLTMVHKALLDVGATILHILLLQL